MKKVKKLRGKKSPSRRRQQYSDHQREGGMCGEVEEGKGRINSDGRRLGIGW